MRIPKGLLALYAVDLALLLAHEIDSAYWHEWEMFGLPGGIQLFALLHVPLVPLALWGYGALVAGRRGGLSVSYLVAGAGILAAIVHGFFLSRGHPAFRLPASIGILAAGLIGSLAQLALTARASSLARRSLFGA